MEQVMMAYMAVVVFYFTHRIEIEGMINSDNLKNKMVANGFIQSLVDYSVSGTLNDFVEVAHYKERMQKILMGTVE